MSGRCDQCDERSSELMCQSCCVGCKARAADMAELDEWRKGKRRVFWRVRRDIGTSWDSHCNLAKLSEAKKMIRDNQEAGYSCRLCRVTVRPKVKR